MRDSGIRSFMVLFAAAMIGSFIAVHLNKINGMSVLAGNNVASRTAASDPNPLLAEWEGPYGGVPPFDKVQVALFKPALEEAMTQNLTEVEAIAKDSAAPNFENTIAALERTGRTLDRVTTIYNVWGSTMAGPEF